MPPEVSGEPLLGPGGIAFVALYLVLLIGVGIAGRVAQQQDSLSDFYLGGRSLGLFVLFLTLYSSQYSGLTFVGFVGQAYRQGYGFLVSITFTIAVIAAYFVLAPRLFRLSRARAYITPGDFLHDRYRSTTLTILSTGIFIFALGSYILTNLSAMGYVVSAATGGKVGIAEAILGLSLLMVVYETLGGMRGVAWTDVIQGILLLAGCLLIFAAIVFHYGGPVSIGETLMQQRPDFWKPPDAAAKRRWLSTLLLVASAVSIYPHAVQRIYAARSEKALRRSLQLMILMPFFTMLPMVLVGFVGAARFPGLDTQKSEQVLMIILRDFLATHPGFQIPLVLLMAAIIAAIMSTVDSALLSISSLFTQDFYRRLAPQASQSRLTLIGKLSSWVLMAAMAYLAIILPQTLWRLTEIKLEILCQAAPAIYLGLHWRALGWRPVLAGISVGIVVTVLLFFAADLGLASSSRPWGIHGGVWALGANVLTVVLVSRVSRRNR